MSLSSQHVLDSFENMDSMDMSPRCKISMLWNWNTIDACFLARSWHIRSTGAMAASCIGVLLLTVCLEGLRRLGKEYDAYLNRGYSAQAASQLKVAENDNSSSSAGAGNGSGSDDATLSGPRTFTFRASPLQQLARAVIHAVTFGVAYIVMLLAMYFNGYIIISIFVGAGIGKFLCDWLVVKVTIGNGCSGAASQDTNEHAIDEPTICCG